MKKRSLWIITGLMTLALLGVFVMQLYYIKESYKLKSQLFEQNVEQALTAVVNKIQKQNAFIHINKKDLELKAKQERDIRSQTDSIVAFKVKFKDAEAQRKFKQQQQVIDYLNFQDSIIRRTYFSPIIVDEETFQAYSDPFQKAEKLQYFVKDIKDGNGNLIKRSVMPDIAKIKRSKGNSNLPDTIRYIAFNPSNMLPFTISLATRDSVLISKFKVEDAKAERRYKMELSKLYADTIDIYSDNNYDLVKDVAKEIENSDVPLPERIPSQAIIDTLLRRELLSKNITLNYNYWLTFARNNKHIIYQNAALKTDSPLPKNTFNKAIFANDVVIKDPGMLYINFPDKNSLIFSNMFVTLASSAGLLLVLIGVFAYTIFAIIRQKKLSEMKTDFINNMTHEFKTPVATIMIASEALKDPEIAEDKQRINRLAGIIYDENVRLGDHIERVLSVARLDKKEIHLNYAEVAVHDLIAAVVDSMQLQLQKKHATIHLNLNATNDILMADELHLSNVIYNLIDNANKYSVENPEINITTKSNEKYLSILVSDNGIGMTKDQTKRVFDQFYRVPTGNLHNVKGFGLGLNYVSNIVNEMDGQVIVNSEKGKGSTFEVILPFKHNN